MANSFTSNQSFKNMTDEQLVLLAQDGDAQALNLIAERMLPVAFACASVYKGASVCREDLVQEGMFGLLSAVRTYSVGRNASFKTYAGVCIRNKITSVVRTSSCDSVSSSVSLGDEDLPDLASNPEDIVIAGERWQSLSDFMAQEFSKFEKDVMGLYLSGNSYHEIAEMLSTHTKAVDNALQRIRRKLKKLA